MVKRMILVVLYVKSARDKAHKAVRFQCKSLRIM